MIFRILGHNCDFVKTVFSQKKIANFQNSIQRFPTSIQNLCAICTGKKRQKVRKKNLGRSGAPLGRGLRQSWFSCGPCWAPLRYVLGVQSEAFLNHWCKMALRWAPRRLLHRFWIDFGDDFEDSAGIWEGFGKILKHFCLHVGRFGQVHEKTTNMLSPRLCQCALTCIPARTNATYVLTTHFTVPSRRHRPQGLYNTASSNNAFSRLRCPPQCIQTMHQSARHLHRSNKNRCTKNSLSTTYVSEASLLV